MLRTDRPAAPSSLMFAGCLWHHWPHNHCWAHQGQGLIFKAFRSTDSLCIHEIDHSGLSVATCASSLQIWEVVAWRGCVLAPALAEAPHELRVGGTLWQQYSQGPWEVAYGPLVIKAVRGRQREGKNGRELKIPSTVASKRGQISVAWHSLGLLRN